MNKEQEGENGNQPKLDRTKLKFSQASRMVRELVDLAQKPKISPEDLGKALITVVTLTPEEKVNRRMTAEGNIATHAFLTHQNGDKPTDISIYTYRKPEKNIHSIIAYLGQKNEPSFSAVALTLDTAGNPINSAHLHETQGQSNNGQDQTNASFPLSPDHAKGIFDIVYEAHMQAEKQPRRTSKFEALKTLYHRHFSSVAKSG